MKSESLHKAQVLARQILGSPGLMISGSKSGFRKYHPAEIPIFNGNVCIDEGKIWYGDLTITLDSEKLQKLADELKIKVYVLSESYARFDYENNPRLDMASFVYEPGKSFPIAKSGFTADSVQVCKLGKYRGKLVYKPSFR